MSKDQIAFLHIPKTGGVAVRNVIGYHFRADEIVGVPDESPVDKAYARRAFAQYRFVHGHFLPVFLEHHFGAVTTVTFLRDPVERVWSLYRFLRAHDPDAALDPLVRERISLARRFALDDFLDAASAKVLDVFENEQTKRLGARSGSDDWASMAGPTLEMFDYVGLAENLGESIASLCALVGWQPPSVVPRLNFTAAAGLALATRTRNRLLTMNEADQDLYDRARALWLRRRTEERRTVGVRGPRATPSAPYGYRLTMNDAICGEGWYEREGLDTGQPWRFAVSGTRARLRIRLATGYDYIMLVTIPFWGPGIVDRSLEIVAQGSPLSLTVHAVREGTVMIGLVPREIIGPDGVVEFAFAPAAAEGTASDPVGRTPDDDRAVSFALREIRFVGVNQGLSPGGESLVQELLAAHARDVELLEREWAKAARHAVSVRSELDRVQDDAKAHVTSLEASLKASQEYSRSLEAQLASLRRGASQSSGAGST
jgi:hypothetical protein